MLKSKVVMAYFMFVCTSEALQKWEGMILKKTRLFRWFSHNSEVEATWTNLIGWPHRTSNRVCSILGKLFSIHCDQGTTQFHHHARFRNQTKSLEHPFVFHRTTDFVLGAKFQFVQRFFVWYEKSCSSPKSRKVVSLK